MDRIDQAIVRVRQHHRPTQVDSLSLTARELADEVERLQRFGQDKQAEVERLRAEVASWKRFAQAKADGIEHLKRELATAERMIQAGVGPEDMERT